MFFLFSRWRRSRFKPYCGAAALKPYGGAAAGQASALTILPKHGAAMHVWS